MMRLILLGLVPLVANGASEALHSDNLTARDLQGAECGVDFDGIRSNDGTGKYCCVKECGSCGTVGCSTTAAALGLGAEECCTGGIKATGRLCSDVMSAPCIIEATSDAEADQSTPAAAEEDEPSVSTCKNGLPGVPSAGGGICCAPECDKCGGSDCSAQDAGGENCCVDPIEESGILCSESGAAPCLIDDDQVADEKETDDDDQETDDVETDDESLPTCSDGTVGVEAASGNVCCPYRCGTCGGDRCKGDGNCCEDTIQRRDPMCSEPGATAPCILERAEFSTPAPVEVPEGTRRPSRYCSNGMLGSPSDDGAVCCDERCSECTMRGEKCAGVPGCCEQNIIESGIMCTDDGVEEGPCIMDMEPLMEYLPDEDMTTEPTTDSTKYAPESGEYDDDYSSQTSTVPESLEADEATTPPTTAEDDEEEEEEEEDEEYVPTCSNGYPGVESSAGDVCCPVGCSECGGEKCVGYGGCCEQKVHDDGVLCSDEGVDAGPCILIPVVDVDYVYDGCYKADKDYEPFTTYDFMEKLYTQKCANVCAEAGHLYMGVMGSNHCGCGSDPDFFDTPKSEGTCDLTCTLPGSSEKCGGEYSYAIFVIED